MSHAGTIRTKILLAAIGVLAAASTGFAADLPTKAPPLPVGTSYDWSGLYVGVHGGGGWQNTSVSDPGAYGALIGCCILVNEVNNPTAATNANGNGFLGGIQAGWMYQTGFLVTGADFDFSWTKMNGSGGSIFSDSSGNSASEAYSTRTNWTSAATATLGIAHDRWMLYSKAGPAWADDSYGLSVAGIGGFSALPFSFTSSTDRILTGWTTGVGLNYAITDNVFVNAEYDFLDFGSRAQHLNGTNAAPLLAFGPTAAATFSPTFNQNISEIKVGLNYKSGAGLGAIAPTVDAPSSYDWTGLYVGGHVGGGWQNTSFADPTEPTILFNCCLVLFPFSGTPSAPTDMHGSGFLGGAQAGWMYQIGRLVAGADVDFSGTHIQGGGSSAYPAGVGTETYGIRTNWTSTATGTLGWSFGPWMVFTKAGAAWADNTYTLGIAGNQVGPYAFSASTDQVVIGWTAGLGLKWAISDHLFVNAEYDLLNFGSQVEHMSGAFSATPASGAAGGGAPVVNGAATFDPSFNQIVQEVKIGLNYKFAPGGFDDGAAMSGRTALPIAAKAPPPTGAYQWSGLYVGGHLGGAWQNVDVSDPSAFSVLNGCCFGLSSTENPAAASNAHGGGILGGVQAGWMYQIQRLVVGADVDFSGTGLKGSSNNALAAVPGFGYFANEAYSVKTNWTATSTVTLGFAKNDWMVYGKAGTAWADNSYNIAVAGAGGFAPYSGPTPFAFTANSDRIVTGWTGGVGVKWALSTNLFVNAEYDLLDFGSQAQHLSGAFTAVPVNSFGFRVAPGATFDPVFAQVISEFKVGLNYKFAPGWSLW